MPLIIETYTQPFSLISDVLFPTKSVSYTPVPLVIPDEDEKYYFTRDIDDFKSIGYYFTKIYYLEDDKIVEINKITFSKKYYNLKTGKLFQGAKKLENSTVKTDEKALPYLDAQTGGTVIFPDPEEVDD